MSEKFSRFIETQGKSPKEIREELERILSGAISGAPHASDRAADNDRKTSETADETIKSEQENIRRKIKSIVMEAGNESEERFAPQKIPPRKRESIRYQPQNRPAQKQLSADEIAFAPDRFPVKISESDRAMNAKIAEMRRLNEMFYNGYLVQQCAELSIIKQGEFMAEVEDNYEHRSFCAVPRPIYGALSNSQLRTYFTWRTKARKGVYEETDEPYVMLYCYELLNKIGTVSAAESFGRLLEINERCAKFCPEIRRRMPRWLKDFYAYNDITGQYPDISEIVGKEGFDGCENDLYERRYAGHLDYFARNSSYNILGSIFLTDKAKPLVDDALAAVWAALDEYLGGRGVSLFELICGKMRKDFSWEPFRGAYVNLDRMEGFRAVRISSIERYCIKRGAPALECFESAPYRGFIGYVVKFAESVLRKRTGFRHPITPNITTALNDIANREKLLEAVSDPAFAETIKITLNDWCDRHGIFPPKKEREKPVPPKETPLPPVKVEIDIEKLSMIREESDDIARRLIIEEEGDLPAEEISEITSQISDDDFAERVAEFSEITSEEETSPAPPAEENRFDFSSLSKTWRGFAESLSAVQIETLAALTRGVAEDYCRRYGLFPETVYEEINTTALDAVGDIVIECGEIIPDYERDIKKIVALADV